MLLNKWVIFFRGITTNIVTGLLDVNVAIHKPACQSSTFDKTANFSNASSAIDGGVNNVFENWTCSHTGYDNIGSAWWEVDLQGQFWIGTVHILNRASCVHRLHDVRVDIYEHKAKPRKEKHCITHPGPAGPGWLNLSCKVPVLGRYVRIIKPKKDRYDVLTLCEVEIYTAKEQLKPMSYRNCCKICG